VQNERANEGTVVHIYTEQIAAALPGTLSPPRGASVRAYVSTVVLYVSTVALYACRSVGVYVSICRHFTRPVPWLASGNRAGVRRSGQTRAGRQKSEGDIASGDDLSIYVCMM